MHPTAGTPIVPGSIALRLGWFAAMGLLRPLRIPSPFPSQSDAHTSLSTRALNDDAVRQGLKGIPLSHSGLWENLRLAAG